MGDTEIDDKIAVRPLSPVEGTPAVSPLSMPRADRSGSTRDFEALPLTLNRAVGNWMRDHKPELLEQLMLQETTVLQLARAQAGAVDAVLAEALYHRLDIEKRILVALVWDATALFERQPLLDPIKQGYQLGLLLEVSDPEGRSFYVASGSVRDHVHEGFQVVPRSANSDS